MATTTLDISKFLELHYIPIVNQSKRKMSGPFVDYIISIIMIWNEYVVVLQQKNKKKAKAKKNVTRKRVNVRKIKLKDKKLK